MKGLETMTENVIAEIVENIKECANELLSSEKNDIEYGELIAYSEALTIIKDCCAGYDIKSIGLDFDIEEKYLGIVKE